MASSNQQASKNQPKSVSSFDAYDAAKIALGRVNSDELAATKQGLLEAGSEIGLNQEDDLDSMIEIFEYISSNPDAYQAAIKELASKDYIDAEDFPEQFDPQFLGTVLAMLHELQASGLPSAEQTTQTKSPVNEIQNLNRGNVSEIASQLASYGRHGDTMLAHITPEEAEILKSRGGSGTINPITGLPEFFLKKLAKKIKQGVKKVASAAKKVLNTPVGRIVGTVALATVLGPAGVGLSTGLAGAAAGAGASLAAGGSAKEALVSGAMGYIGGGGTVMGANPVTAVGSYLPGATGSALNTGLATGAIATGVGKLAGMSTADALKMGITSGTAAGLQNAIGNRIATKPSIGEGVGPKNLSSLESSAYGASPSLTGSPFLNGGVEAPPLTFETAGASGFDVPVLTGSNPFEPPPTLWDAVGDSIKASANKIGDAVVNTVKPPSDTGGLMSWLGAPAAQLAGQAINAGVQYAAADRASEQQQRAAQAAMDEQRRQFDITRQSLAPFVQAGTQALGGFAPYQTAGLQAFGQQQALAGLQGEQAQRQAIGALEASPEYQALARQGEEAILQRASATGGLRGGNVQAALAQFRPAMLQQLIDQQYQRLGGFAGTGLQTTTNLAEMGRAAATQQGTFGANAASNIGSLLTQQGQAQAGGTLGMARGVSELLSAPAQIYGFQRGLRQA